MADANDHEIIKLLQMKKRYYLILPVAALLAFVMSCGKNGSFPSTPDLKFKSIGPYEVHQKDSVIVTCSFRDQEGDIQDSIYYKASNSTVYGSYAIPDFPKQQNLQGNIVVILERGVDFGVPPGGAASDTIYFDLYLKDVAGHVSDTVKTTPIVVHGS